MRILLKLHRRVLIGLGFSSHTNAVCKIRNLPKRGKVIARGGLYNICAIKNVMYLGPRITESSCPYAVRRWNNIKRGITLLIEIDSMFNIYIQLDWIFSKIQVLKSSLSPVWTQFPCNSCVFGHFFEHKCKISTFAIIRHIYINTVSAFFFSYNLKSDTRGPVFNFSFTQRILMLILMCYTHGSLVAIKVNYLKHVFYCLKTVLNLNSNSHWKIVLNSNLNSNSCVKFELDLKFKCKF